MIKKNKSNIAYWTYEDIPNKLWPITDLSSVWQIGKRLEKRLLNMNIHSIYDLAHTSSKRLQKNFGKMGLLLFEHANGIDNTIIKNIKTPTQKSLGHSQVLYKDYYNEECLLIIKEMLGHLTEKLRLKNLECQSITLFCSYSKGQLPVNRFFIDLFLLLWGWLYLLTPRIYESAFSLLVCR